MRDEDDFLEPRDHSGDPESDPTAVDPDHTPDLNYREVIRTSAFDKED